MRRQTAPGRAAPGRCPVSFCSTLRGQAGSLSGVSHHQSFGCPHRGLGLPGEATLIGLVLCGLLGLHASALEWQPGAGFRNAPLVVSPSGRTGFTKLAGAQTGVTFTNLLSDTKAAENQIRLSGSGVALGDVDGDGWCDVYLGGQEGPNALYRNLGHWRFTDITLQAGVACPGQWTTGTALADGDGDGDLDLFVTALGTGTRLFLNDGKGRFTEAVNAGLVRKFGAMSMALADVDGDGDLDLYVTNYRTQTVRSTGLEILNVNGRRMLKPEDRDQMYFTPGGFLREHGEVDILYLNDGTARFTAVSWTEGAFVDETGQSLAGPPRDWGFSVLARDLTGDGAPDLYVCNDFWTPDRFWINDGTGRFRASPRVALPCTSSFSMGVDAADINRDGHDDLFVLDMLSPVPERRMRQSARDEPPAPEIGLPAERSQVERNTLFLNRGDGTYAEIAEFSGVSATEWSWCPMFLDVDLDGYEDLLISCGYGFDTQDRDADNQINALGPWPREKVPFKLLMYPRLPLPCVALRNRGDLTFENLSAAWGFDFEGYSHGMAAADLDHDGDLDVVVNHMNAEAGLYRNDAAAPRLSVRLKGLPPNTRGVGARIKVLGGPVSQSQEMTCGGRFLSSDDTLRVFAAGNSAERLSIEVTWRSNKQSVVPAAQPNHIYEIDEAGARAPEAEPARGQGERPGGRPANAGRPMNTVGSADSTALPNHESLTTTSAAPVASLFTDVSHLLGHRHHETLFDDFARQPLLPYRLSQLGPGVCWFDLDADGWEDLVIGSGRGGQLAVFRNNGREGFTRWVEPPVNSPVTRDQGAVLGVTHEDGRPRLLVASANYEDALARGSPVRTYDFYARAVLDELPGQASSAGPLALGDFDADGDLDLFVGGRVVPGRYPEPASSLVCVQEGGKFRVDTALTKLLENVGLVAAALWSDLTGDGWPELVLACEWGPIKVFKNDQARLQPWNPPVSQGPGTRLPPSLASLDSLTGWWTSVNAGDFDGDGRLDLVAGNWGHNTKYQAQAAEPLRVWFGDLDANGTVELIEAYLHVSTRRLLPWRDLDTMVLGLPWLRERFPTYESYGKADVPAILAEKAPLAKELSATILSSVVLLNRDARFELRELPLPVQLAPVFGLCVADFDGDGREDIFANQNLLAVEPLSAPYGSGVGVVLQGDGEGRFSPWPVRASGVRVHGEGRGAAVCDYDGDGRVDLVAAQNGGETRLFRNAAARPGLRVRLKGPSGNPFGVGAVAWLSREDRRGPAREVHAGAGYWSQDSPVQVMSLEPAPTECVVRWPGGRRTSTRIPTGAREITIDTQGRLSVGRYVEARSISP